MKISFHQLFWFWLPPVGYMIAIFFMSSMPDPQIGTDAPDYVLHCVGYFVLTLLLIRLFLAEQPSVVLKLTRYISGSKNTNHDFLFWNVASLAAVLTAIAYGITDELHQYFTPGRHCSFKDVSANSFGAFLAYGISMLDYLIFTRTSFQNRLKKRMKRLGGISYAGYIRINPRNHFSGLRFSPK